MNIERNLYKTINNKFFKGKAIVLIGPRQTGKTTLINNLIKSKGNYLFLDGDDLSIQQTLSDINTQELKKIIGKYKIIFIDEAQRINRIGLTAKIINDQFKDVQLILSGSSSFDLNNKINEPLTGRKWEYNLYPISWNEFQNHFDYITAKQQLNTRLIYGMYPDVINNLGNEKEVLSSLTNSYLYKDIFMLANIKKPDILQKLVQALAYQIGSEVSYNELANLLKINKETVSSYINILEKAFIIFRVTAYSKNLRNEIKFNKKIYFYDNGIRNAVINSFNNIELRRDKGALWENFLISERIKHLHYNQQYTNYYFWRTKQGQEIDWVEEKNQELSAYEFKWKKKKITRFPKTFISEYNPTTNVIDTDNYTDFLM